MSADICTENKIKCIDKQNEERKKYNLIKCLALLEPASVFRVGFSFVIMNQNKIVNKIVAWHVLKGNWRQIDFSFSTNKRHGCYLKTLMAPCKAITLSVELVEVTSLPCSLVVWLFFSKIIPIY